MANKKTSTLTKQQYEEIITTMRTGGVGFRANERIATALILEANLGLRINDILALKPNNIIKDGKQYYLDIVESQPQKKRQFILPKEIYKFISEYCKKYNISSDERMFPFAERTLQNYLQKVTKHLGYENIGTHSFRKFFATDILEKNDYNIVLVQRLLQHSSPTATQKYLGIESKEIENALKEHITLL